MTSTHLLRPIAVALIPLAFATAAWCAPPNRARTERRNILLITVESLRTDRLGCYTGGRRSTPALDALAQRGLRFGRAYAASPSTAPSVATILTGRYPSRHGIRDDLEGRLEDGIVTLAEILTRDGYRTGAVVGSSRLDSRHGLNRGFGTYDDVIKPTSAKMIIAISKERPAEEVVVKGLEFLDSGDKERPFLLWLDFFDAHYEHTAPGPPAKETESDPYQGEVTYIDNQISVLVAGLQARKLDRTTHIVLAGTHGEGLGDHGETGHGIYLYETTIRVPLIIAPAGGRPAKIASAQLVDRLVSLVDLAPTVLEFAGIDPPGGLEGISLTSFLNRAGPKHGKSDKTAERLLFVEAVQPWAAYGWSPLFAVIEAEHKIVWGRRTEAFDLRADSDEKRPIAPTPEWAARLEEFGRPLLGPLGLSEEERQKLTGSLAPLQLPWAGEPYCLEKQDWPDPRDRVELNDKLFRARAAFDKGWVGQASILSQEILEVDRANFTALELVSFLAVRNDWNDILMENLDLLQCGYPFRGTAYHYWAHFRERNKDPQGAEKALLAFSWIEPRNDEAFYDLAAFYAAEGKKGLAFDNLRKAIELGADDFEEIRRDQRLRALMDDPRFAELLGSVPPSPTSAGDHTRR